MGEREASESLREGEMKLPRFGNGSFVLAASIATTHTTGCKAQHTFSDQVGGKFFAAPTALLKAQHVAKWKLPRG